MSDDPPVIYSRVAHFGYGDTRFCGYGVRADLVGRCGYWSTISLALGGPRLSRNDERILDGLSVASVNAEPRIWPLRLSRVLASEGSALVGMAGAVLGIEGGLMGASAMDGSARFLVSLRQLAEAAADPEEAIEAEVLARLAAGRRLVGYGVPFREGDERVLGALDLVEVEDFTRKPYWKLAATVERIALTQKITLQMNIGAAMSAICLDMGFTPEQIGPLAALLLLNNMVANAFEGAEQACPLFRHMPREFVEYQGPVARKTPRALAREAE